MNVVFILTDEQRYDTSLPYGNAEVQTPHLNQLGEEALVFEQAYVTQPVCSPARSAILTGRWPHQTGVIANNIPLPDSIPVFPALFPDDAYQTAYMGKWHLGNELDLRKGFDQRISTEDIYTADDTTRFSDYRQWLIDKGYTPDTEQGYFSREFCNRLPYAHTKSKFMEEQALRFLEENRNRPFMLYLGFLEPHTPNFGPFDSLHRAADVALDPTYGDVVPEDEPLRYALLRNPGQSSASQEKLREEMAKYWGLVHQVDRSVGAIIGKLKSLGLYENTLLVYTSEHGKMMGKYGLGGKSVMYEAAARVPLFLKIPGVRPRRIAYPVSQIDLVPTLLDALKRNIPPSLPGKSLLPYLDAPDAGDVFVEWHQNRAWADLAERCPEGVSLADCEQAMFQQIRTVITPRGWKLNRSVADADRSQLFDLRDDPAERHNRYYQAGYVGRIDSLQGLIKAWQEEVADPAGF